MRLDTPSPYGGTSSTGNVARDCLMDKRDFLKWATSSIDPIDRASLDVIQTHLSVILRLVNSSENINTLKFEELCKETYEFILTKFSWANITPSLHKLLSHCYQIIQSYNNGYGLRNISEECLESCNKYVRRFQENLSRKFSFTDNVRDIQIRLLCCSDWQLIVLKYS